MYDSIVVATPQFGANVGYMGWEDKVKAGGERIDVDRDETLDELEKRLARRRAFFAESKEKGFDEDDDFWTRGLATWAEESVLPPLEDARKLVGGLFLELVPQITTEDAKKIRELVRNAAIRDDRKLTPRELEQVATAAEQILAAIQTLEKELGKATGAKKGAITKGTQPAVAIAISTKAMTSDTMPKAIVRVSPSFAVIGPVSSA